MRWYLRGRTLVRLHSDNLGVNPLVRQRLDRLIDTWEFWPDLREVYLDEHVPRLAKSLNLGWLGPEEFDAALDLLEVLGPERWRDLPRLIRQRLTEIEAEEAARKARLQAAQRKEAEQKRVREEAERVARDRREAAARLAARRREALDRMSPLLEKGGRTP